MKSNLRTRRSSFLRYLLIAKGSILTVAASIYTGHLLHHQIQGFENSVLRGHMEWVDYSHRGSLRFEDAENDQGMLEKRVRNAETDKVLYVIRPNGLPPNDYIFPNLKPTNMEEAQEIADRAMTLYNQAVDVICANTPIEEGSIDPRYLKREFKINDRGKLETTILYKGKPINLTEEQFNQQVGKLEPRTPEPAERSEQDPSQPVEAAIANESSGLKYPILGVVAVGGVGLAYRRHRQKQNA